MRINSFGYVLSQDSPISRKQLGKFVRSLLFLACDIDGCLIPGNALETAKNKNTVESFLKKNKFAAEIFRSICNILVMDGVKIGLCTGRSAAFAKKIAKAMFVPGTCVFMVAEGGAVKSFYQPLTGEWKDQVPSYIDQESVAVFKDNKASIIRLGTEVLGGHLEPGKAMITSFNPPAGMTMDEYKGSFLRELRNLEIHDKINFENSSSAVDIAPLGVNKVACLREVVGEASTAVLVDATNDAGVTKEFLVNLMPGNAHEGIKELAMQAMISIQSDFESLYGTSNMFTKLVELRGYAQQPLD